MKTKIFSILLVLVLLLSLLPMAAQAAAYPVDSFEVTGIPVLYPGLTTDDCFAMDAPATADTRLSEAYGEFVKSASFDDDYEGFAGTFEAGETYYLFLGFSSQSEFEETCTVTVDYGKVVDSRVAGKVFEFIVELEVPEIFVGGKGMVSGQYLSNSGKLSTSKPSGGYAYFKNGKLTLNNYQYKGAGIYNVDDEKCNDLVNYIGDLTIEITGTNKLEGVGDNLEIYGIVVYGKLTIDETKPGSSLTVTVPYENAFYATGKFTVNGGTVTAITTEANPTRVVYAIDADNGLEFDAAKMNITVSQDPSGTPAVEYIETRLALYCYVRLEPVSYTVSFAAGGGSGTMADVTKVYGSYTLPENGFTAPAGKQFKAWSVGGAEKAAGSKITVSANTTLTAVWEDIPAGQPSQPTEPSVPSQPTDPSDPSQPSTPTEPSASTPSQPTTGNDGGASGQGEPAPKNNGGWMWLLILLLLLIIIILLILLLTKKKKEEKNK